MEMPFAAMPTTAPMKQTTTKQMRMAMGLETLVIFALATMQVATKTETVFAMIPTIVLQRPTPIKAILMKTP